MKKKCLTNRLSTVVILLQNTKKNVLHTLLEY